MRGHGGSIVLAGDTHDGGNKATTGKRMDMRMQMGRGEEVNKKTFKKKKLRGTSDKKLWGKM